MCLTSLSVSVILQLVLLWVSEVPVTAAVQLTGIIILMRVISMWVISMRVIDSEKIISKHQSKDQYLFFNYKK